MDSESLFRCKDAFHQTEAKLKQQEQEQHEEHQRLLEEKLRLEDKVAYLRERQATTCKKAQEAHCEYQKKISEAKRVYKETCKQLKEKMELESESFRLSSQRYSAECELSKHRLNEVAASQRKLHKEEVILSERMLHVKELYHDYKANQSQLAANYAQLVISADSHKPSSHVDDDIASEAFTENSKNTKVTSDKAVENHEAEHKGEKIREEGKHRPVEKQKDIHVSTKSRHHRSHKHHPHHWYHHHCYENIKAPIAWEIDREFFDDSSSVRDF